VLAAAELGVEDHEVGEDQGDYYRRPRRTPSSSAASRIGSAVGAMFSANTSAPAAATSRSPPPPWICSAFSPPRRGASATPRRSRY
jgi:hypothetical protein